MHHVLPRDGKRWDGLFYWSPSQKHGTLYIFRPDSQDSQQTVKLKGLFPSQSYKLWSEDGSITSCTLTGSTLMSNGLQVYLASPYTSDLIFVASTTP